MKKIILLSLLFGITLTSCDFVGNPYPEVNANLGDTSSCPTPAFPIVTSHIKKILIEDYTGHTCANCPNAAKELHEIDSTYPGKIVGLGIHVGSFAVSSPGYGGTTPPAFVVDYRTPTGDSYDAVFGADAFGLPQGVFNRKEFDATTQTHLKFYPNWDTYIAGIISEPSVVDLQMIVDFDTVTRKICLAVKDSFLNTSPIIDTLKLVVLLSQDSIISWQHNVTVLQSNYVHRHVLRDAITPSGAWGEALTMGSIPVGTTHINKFAYNVPSEYNGVACNLKHCHLIAYIYKVSTKEIIQVEEIKLTP